MVIKLSNRLWFAVDKRGLRIAYMALVSMANVKDTLNLFMADRILYVMVKIIYSCRNKNRIENLITVKPV